MNKDKKNINCNKKYKKKEEEIPFHLKFYTHSHV